MLFASHLVGIQSNNHVHEFSSHFVVSHNDEVVSLDKALAIQYIFHIGTDYVFNDMFHSSSSLSLYLYNCKDELVLWSMLLTKKVRKLTFSEQQTFDEKSEQIFVSFEDITL